MNDYWLGIDAGTTAIKVGIYQPNGKLLSLGEVENQVQTGSGGISQQDMDAVWYGVCAAIQQSLEGIDDPSRIGSIGICAQGDGFWPLDENNRPTGPAILWNDTRAAEQVKLLYDSGNATAVSHACHTSIWPGTSGAIFQWMRKHDPQRADETARVIHCAGWVGYCLTGELSIDFSDASIPFLDLSERNYSQQALQSLDSDLLGDKLLMPRAADSLLGRISHEAAQATGLAQGTPVAVGTLDLAAMIVGMGMQRSGQTMMILGTTAVVNILVDQYTRSDLPVGATALHATKNLKIRVLAPTTGAAAFDWFSSLHPKSLSGENPAEIAHKLNVLVEQVPPGSNGVTFLPYLNGERAPFVAPDARASFLGLSQHSTVADMGRAVMEGAAFSLRHCIEAEGIDTLSTVQLTGGGAKNSLWCQIIADVVQAPIQVSELSDHGLWGAACLGAAAADQGDACVIAERSEDSRLYTPDPTLKAQYDKAFKHYLICSELYRTIQFPENEA